ncbi:MAG: hypothetical protein A2498_11080 [Lentisphaerae bacterium RIFOXYC12_FULL_60_16]|nr:MAG: hypothetical protein A2498_11080 [Lentisphaerae bacterium RIFOXYC12_FULL_60_16]OGV76217.1 MAG: hypothetical protein A2340_00155 [Lentisphaerae bacterium RIFOXYB12_FULL_60_10]
MVIALVFLALARLYNLGTMDTRSDEVWVLQYLQAGHGTGDMAKFCLDEFKPGRQMPLSRMTNAILQDVLRWPVNLFTIRLPYAIMGMLTIIALYCLGKAIPGDRHLGWVLAWMGAINPYLFHWSKIAHNYSFVKCLFTFGLAGFAFVMRDVVQGLVPRKRVIGGFCAASILACYSHMSVWPAVGLLWLSLVGYLWIRHERRSSVWIPVGVGFGLLVMSLLPWMLMFISALFTAKETFLPPNADVMTQWKHLAILPQAMTWGGGWRTVITYGLLVAAIVDGVLNRQKRKRLLYLVTVTLLVFIVLFVMQYYAGGNFEAVRYYTPVWTSLILVSGVGVLAVGQWLARVPGLGRLGELGGSALASLLLGMAMVNPLIWTVTLPATSIPYTVINRWMDANLPAGAPVLVDRWLEPWNEMKTHAPSNVVVTFTIPNEPVEMFKKYQWRDTAKQFLTRYPDAAYLEIVKQYFFDPTVGWWDWPRQYFRQRVVFTNEQALALARINMMPNPIATFPGSNTNRIITELFYNTRDDMIAIARREGRSWVLFYASGWGYHKLWPQMQDFRDWRVLGDRAVVDIHNLSDQSTQVKLRIRGAAPVAGKSIRIGDGPGLAFPRGQVMEVESQVLELRPGANVFTISGGTGESARAPLLVETIFVQAAGL